VLAILASSRNTITPKLAGEAEFLDYLGFKFSAHEKGFNTAKLRPARKQNVGQFLSSIIINMHSFLRVMTKL